MLRITKKLILSVSLTVLSFTSNIATNKPAIAQVNYIGQFETIDSRDIVRNFIKRLVILNYLQETSSPNYLQEYELIYKSWQRAKEDVSVRHTENSYKISKMLYHHKQYQIFSHLATKLPSVGKDNPAYNLAEISMRQANSTATSAIANLETFSIYEKECTKPVNIDSEVCKF